MGIDDPIIIHAASHQHIPDMLRLERNSATAAHWSEAQYGCLFQADEGQIPRLVLVAQRDIPRERSDRAPTVVAFLIARYLAYEWELENIVVAPEARGQGIGTHLMTELLARATQASSHSVFLEVRESNAPARALYQKLGFLQTGRRKSYYNNPVEDAILYCKNLGQRQISS